MSRVEELAILAGFNISGNNLIYVENDIDADEIIRRFAELIRADVKYSRRIVDIVQQDLRNVSLRNVSER